MNYLKTILVIALLVFTLGCASSKKEISVLTKTAISPSSNINQVIAALGQPIKTYQHKDKTVLYYCENPTWNTMKRRYFWFDEQQLLADNFVDAKGVICDKGMPTPSFSGLAYNDYSLMIPTSTRYGQDALQVCTDALSSQRYANVPFDFLPPLFSVATGAYDYPSRTLTTQEKMAVQSLIILLNECMNVAPKRQKKYLVNLFGSVPKEILEKVSFEIKTMFQDRRIAEKRLFNDLLMDKITLNEAYERLLTLEESTNLGKRDVLTYIADFKQKVAIARAGKTEVKTNVRVVNDGGIIPRCRMTGKC